MDEGPGVVKGTASSGDLIGGNAETDGRRERLSASDSPYSARYTWYAIVLLAVVSMFNYMDRMALAVLAPFIKADLELSDAELGLLTGFAFALFYAICGIPIARWADRGTRRNIIAIALAMWSVFTALSGAAQNFWHLIKKLTAMALSVANRVKYAALFMLVGAWATDSSAFDHCEGLVTGKFINTEITKAETVVRGAFIQPSDDWKVSPATFKKMPEFCRVVGVIRPATDSEIGFELWLPRDWNGRYLQTGNGGFAGAINYSGLVPGLRNHFAVASTDGGHTDNTHSATWALGHPEKVVDYGYRAVHLTSIVSKEIVSTYYGRKFARAYFSGCSNGGREALMEAQRFPDDFDGWIVGAPANNFTSVMTHLLNISQISTQMKDPLLPSQIEAISKSILQRCDATDGVADGVIQAPLQCRFDPVELLCNGAFDGRCLSESQIEAVNRLYDDTRDARTLERLTPSLQGIRGAEMGDWSWIGPLPQGNGWSAVLSRKLSESFWRSMVYGDPNLDIAKLDLLRAFKDGRSSTGIALNAVDPDLSAVRASGKKIIHFHGWADASIPAEYSIAYYEAVETYLRGDSRDFYRLFMVPGMHHCSRGPGPNSFGSPYDSQYREFAPENHLLAALVRWVEQGEAPQRIVVTKYQDDDPAKPVVRTRPLCVYPKIARWTGKGSTDEAANFECAE